VLKRIVTLLAPALVAASLAACAGLPLLSSGIEPASLQAGGSGGPEMVHLPRYAITGAPPVKAATVVGLSAMAEKLANGGQEQFDVVTLFYGTNRAPAAPSAKTAGIGAGAGAFPRYSAARAAKLSTGIAQVTVPRYERAIGGVQRPRQVAVLSVDVYTEKEDPRRHFTIGNLRELPRDQFFGLANAHGAKSRDSKDQAFVFVHGYNSTFEDAIYRTAQLAHDMAFDGVPYVFAWPSKGETLAYPYDRESLDSSVTHLTDFLDMIAKRTNARKIHIIAHSMGARLVVDTLFPARASSQAGKIAKIGEVILAAADIDRTVLEQRAGSIKAAGKPVTLYASRNDYALTASKQFSGGVARAGDVPEGGPALVPGIETIDISETSTAVFSGLNHATFAEKAHVLTDMSLLLRNGQHPPDKRFAVFAPVAGGAGTGTYWRYVRN
jgi:esterase/lipase superfamily enzyme